MQLKQEACRGFIDLLFFQCPFFILHIFINVGNNFYEYYHLFSFDFNQSLHFTSNSIYLFLTEAVPPANPSWEFQLRLNEFRIFKESEMIEEMADAEYVILSPSYFSIFPCRRNITFVLLAFNALP